MKKLIAVFGFCLCLVACDNNAPKPQEDKPVVKIGVIVSTTGNVAEQGKNNQAAMLQAYEDSAKDNLDFKLIIENDEFNATRAAMITHKLINVDKVDALITWSATSGSVAAPIADQAEMFHLSITNNKDVAQGKYNFIHFTDTASQVQKVLEIFKKNNARRVVLFAGYQSGLQYTADHLEAELKRLGIAVVRHNFSQEEKNFTLMIEKAKEQNYDMWYVSAVPPSLDLFLRAFTQQQVDKPLTAVASFSFTKHKELVEGREFVDTPDGNDYVKQKVKERTGSENSFSIGFSYDAVKIVLDLYNEFYAAHKRLPTTQELAQALRDKPNLEGSVGKLTVLENGEIKSSAVIKKIVDGKVVTLE